MPGFTDHGPIRATVIRFPKKHKKPNKLYEKRHQAPESLAGSGNSWVPLWETCTIEHDEYGDVEAWGWLSFPMALKIRRSELSVSCAVPERAGTFKLYVGIALVIEYNT